MLSVQQFGSSPSILPKIWFPIIFLTLKLKNCPHCKRNTIYPLPSTRIVQLNYESRLTCWHGYMFKLQIFSALFSAFSLHFPYKAIGLHPFILENYAPVFANPKFYFHALPFSNTQNLGSCALGIIKGQAIISFLYIQQIIHNL